MILAIDSSSGTGSAALVDAGRLLREVTFAGGRSRGGGAPRALEELAVGEEEIHSVVVGTGPGSYNGIRSAIAVAWGFCAARGIPLSPVSSLLALAPGEYLAAGDARQGIFYLAHIREGLFEREPGLVSQEDLSRAAAGAGGLPLFFPADPGDGFPTAVVATPRAALLAGLAPATPVSAAFPLPIYLKPPNITPPRSTHAR